MRNQPSYNDKLASSELPLPLKERLTNLGDQVESLESLLPTRQRRRLDYLLERLVNEVLEPDMEMHLWEVALDMIAKAARSLGKPGELILTLVDALKPDLLAYFGPPGEVTLREITEETVRDVILLSDTLTEPKSNFVAPNAVSLSQALFSQHAWYRAIYAGKSLVGFLMLYDNPDEPTYFLWRFMIAEPYHGRGYARQAIQRLIEHVRTRPGAKELLLSCGEGEGNPEGFYAKQGFTRTGEVQGNEVVMRISL